MSDSELKTRIHIVSSEANYEVFSSDPSESSGFERSFLSDQELSDSELVPVAGNHGALVDTLTKEVKRQMDHRGGNLKRKFKETNLQPSRPHRDELRSMERLHRKMAKALRKKRKVMQSNLTYKWMMESRSNGYLDQAHIRERLKACKLLLRMLRTGDCYLIVPSHQREDDKHSAVTDLLTLPTETEKKAVHFPGIQVESNIDVCLRISSIDPVPSEDPLGYDGPLQIDLACIRAFGHVEADIPAHLVMQSLFGCPVFMVEDFTFDSFEREARETLQCTQSTFSQFLCGVGKVAMDLYHITQSPELLQHIEGTLKGMETDGISNETTSEEII